jgi:spermidine synthase
VPSRKLVLAPVSLMGLAAAGGFVALSYETVFFRAVTDATSSSAFAFAATLGAFLVGLAFGARQAGENCAALTREGAMRRALAALMKASLLGLLFLPLFDHMAWLDRASIGAAVLMIYLVARGWGSLMPYLAELGVAADAQAGWRTATLSAAGSLGAATGAVFTGLALLDRIGLVATGMAVVVAGGVCRAVDRRAQDAALGKDPAGEPGGGAGPACNGRDPELVGEHVDALAGDQHAAGRAAARGRGKSGPLNS